MTGAVSPLPAQAYVYVIGAEDGPQKIGVANDPQSRRAMLQTGNPSLLGVAAAVPVARRHALAVEKQAHRILKSKRIRGEWFNVSPEEAADAIRLAVDAVVNACPVEIPCQPISPVQMRMARAGLGWGVRDLAERTGLQPGTISRIENGKEAMGGSLRKIEEAFREAGVEFPDEGTVSIRKPPL